MSPRGRLQIRLAIASIVAIVLTASVVLFQRTSPHETVALATASAEDQPVTPATDVAPAAATAPAGEPTVQPTGQAVVVASAPPVPVPTATESIPVAAEPTATSTEPFQTVTPYRASVVVDLGDDDDGAVVSDEVAGLEDVVHVSEVSLTQTTLGGVPARVAEVDVADYRSFTPDATANHAPLWERIDAGDVAVTHEFGTTHDVPLGSLLATDLTVATGQPREFRVGAFATNGTPPIADAIVGRGRLPEGGARQLLIALAEEGSPTATVETLIDMGLTAEEIRDPRAPRSETVVPVGGITVDNVWDHLALCESSGDWQINTGNGYYGGIQFLPESWAAVGGQGLPHEHSREEQIYRGTLLWQIQGWNAWPQCARKLGLIVDPPAAPTATPSASAQPVQPVQTEPAE